MYGIYCVGNVKLSNYGTEGVDFMICPKCGTDNEPSFKFCVKCGSNLEDPDEINIEQVDMGGYRSEEDYDSDKNSFKISSGTFTINDNAPSQSHGMFTADELNDTDEEFDFSSIDEPYTSQTGGEGTTAPDTGINQPVRGFQQGTAMPRQPMAGMQPMNNMGAMPQQPVGMGMPAGNQMPQQSVQMQAQNPPGANAYMNPMYAGQPPVYGQPPVMPQPQIIGYDQSGMPIYSQPQPMMYAQPQVIGYDQNGMPIYGQPPQPMMYAQPQVIGYDQNGMPIYGQPAVYNRQPLYNEKGEPVSPAPMNAGPMGANPGMPAPGAYGATPPAQNAPGPKAHENGGNAGGSAKSKFWDDLYADDEDDDSRDDFFSKPAHHRPGDDMGSVSAEGMDMSRLNRREHKKVSYMGDTPNVNAADLRPNDNDRINKLYMRGTGVREVNADDLRENPAPYKFNYMSATQEVDAGRLEANEHKKSRVTMKFAGEANPDELETFERKHTASIMDQDLKPVEALPKKKSDTNDEIDKIELPEYMQARKTSNSDKEPEIPEIPKK